MREIKTERLEAALLERLETDTEIDISGEHLTSTKNLPKKRKRDSSITSEGSIFKSSLWFIVFGLCVLVFYFRHMYIGMYAVCMHTNLTYTVQYSQLML